MSKMEVSILAECGFKQAMLGLSLSKEQPVAKMSGVARRLAHKDAGHNKFLEFMVVYLDINAPRYWWQQMDAYRVGISKLSGSTMHNILKHPLLMSDFVNDEIDLEILGKLNEFIAHNDILALKRALPEGYMQRRIVMTNYKTLRNIATQRWFETPHKLPEWQIFMRGLGGLEFRELLGPALA